ncbi:MAG: cyclic nucleotide-binding domain-containing protein [Candidatus Binatia bacterium]
MDTALLQRILLPFLFGLTAAALVGVLRGFGALGRLRVWAVLTGVASGAYLALRGSGLAWEGSILQALSAIAMLAATAALLRLVDLIFWDWFLSKRRHITVPRLAIDLFKLLALVGVAIAILKFDYGMELSGLLVTSTVVSAVIGLAIQDMLANVAAGLGVQLERPFNVGDWLLIGDHEGVVTQLNWRTLTLLTRDRHEVLVPNSTVAKTVVINYCRPSTLQRVHTSVGVAYGHPPGIVKAALSRAASASPEVAANPPVEVLLRSFGDSSIDYDVRFWIHDYGRLFQILDGVNSRIWYELHRCGLTIAFPQRDVTLRTASDEQEKSAAERRRREIFAVLRPLPVFAPLSDEQIETLVGGAHLHEFMEGEALVRQGEHGASLFVIRSGSVRIEKSVDGGPAARMATLGVGDFFGEMSLLTGEPRSASILAEDEVEVVVVSKEAFAPVLAADSGIIVGLSAALEARARDTAERLAELPASAGAEVVRPSSSALLRRIGRFFGVEEK